VSTGSSSRSPSIDARPARDRLAEDLRLAVTRLARRLRQHADGGLSPSQLSALATIERRGPLTLGELASAERIQPPTVTAAVARLEEADLVARSTDDRDRRVSRVAVTATGAEFLKRSRRAKEAYLAQRLATLDEKDRRVLARAAALIEAMLAQDASTERAEPSSAGRSDTPAARPREVAT
jgi:DNA-binding MarR family transcriptional regulator